MHTYAAGIINATKRAKGKKRKHTETENLASK